jgi:hypothetical protein
VLPGVLIVVPAPMPSSSAAAAVNTLYVEPAPLLATVLRTTDSQSGSLHP